MRHFVGFIGMVVLFMSFDCLHAREERALDVPRGVLTGIPKDGEWAIYQVVKRETGQADRTGDTICLSFVGTQEIKPHGRCRWLEITSKRGPGNTTRWKVLVPEAELLDKQPRVPTLVACWRQVDDGEPLNFGGVPATELMRAVGQLIGSEVLLEQKTTEQKNTTLGASRCQIWNGSRQFLFQPKVVKTNTVETWISEDHDSPFAVVATKTSRTNDKNSFRTEIEYQLADSGNGALAQISTVEGIDTHPMAAADGWKWAIPPYNAGGPNQGFKSRFRYFGANACMVNLYVEWLDGTTMAYANYRSDAPIPPKYRVVAFDKALRRRGFSNTFGFASLDFGMEAFMLHDHQLHADEVAFIGLEMLNPDGEEVQASAARREAERLELQPLPFPEVGHSYDFTALTTDGKELKASDLRGKVVLIDWWASHCGPCIQKMPYFQQIQSRVGEDRLAIIGVNIDESEESMRRVVERLELTWPQIRPPEEESHRRLWIDAVGVHLLPRLFVLDSEGILRADSSLDDVESTLQELLAEDSDEG